MMWKKSIHWCKFALVKCEQNLKKNMVMRRLIICSQDLIDKVNGTVWEGKKKGSGKGVLNWWKGTIVFADCSRFALGVCSKASPTFFLSRKSFPSTLRLTCELLYKQFQLTSHKVGIFGRRFVRKCLRHFIIFTWWSQRHFCAKRLSKIPTLWLVSWNCLQRMSTSQEHWKVILMWNTDANCFYL